MKERESTYQFERRIQDIKNELERQADHLKAENLKLNSEFEKKIVLMEQELVFCKRDQENLNENIKQKTAENQKIKEKNATLAQKLKVLISLCQKNLIYFILFFLVQNYKRKIVDTESLKEQEISSLKSDFEKKLDEVTF